MTGSTSSMDSSVPRSLGFIMDGNRRWARAQGLPTLKGHEAGARKVTEAARWAFATGIAEVTVYAFSTENWNRAEEEVSYLMALFERYFVESAAQLADDGICVRFIGDRSRASARVQDAMRHVEERTEKGRAGTLCFAFSYGGRPEILAAVNRLIREGAQDVDERTFAQALWSAGMTDPDLIIRTGGERRLSNFLTWQSAYSELFFTDTPWPDFSEGEFQTILADYAARERRHGV